MSRDTYNTGTLKGELFQVNGKVEDGKFSAESEVGGGRDEIGRKGVPDTPRSSSEKVVGAVEARTR